MTHLTEVCDAGSEGCGAGEQLLYEAARELEARRHVPHRLLPPQPVQHQGQVETPHRKLIHRLKICHNYSAKVKNRAIIGIIEY